MDLVVLVLIWIVASACVGLVAQQSGSSGLRLFFMSVLLSPVVGIVVIIFKKFSAQAQKTEAPEVNVEVSAEKLSNADTAVLTPEEAEALLLKATEGVHPAARSEMAALQNADTNVFSPEEMEAIRQIAKDQKE